MVKLTILEHILTKRKNSEVQLRILKFFIIHNHNYVKLFIKIDFLVISINKTKRQSLQEDTLIHLRGELL